MIIYKTIFPNGKIYIGKDATDNPNYYGSGSIAKKAIRKYGRASLKKEILDQCYSLEHMNFMECFWIQKYPECKVENGGYNITNGGEGEMKGFKHSKESRNKMSLAKIGKKHSEESNKKMSLTRTGKKIKSYKLSEESKKKRRLNYLLNQNKPSNAYGKHWKLKEETKQKMRKPQSKEHLEKRRKSITESWKLRKLNTNIVTSQIFF